MIAPTCKHRKVYSTKIIYGPNGKMIDWICKRPKCHAKGTDPYRRQKGSVEYDQLKGRTR